MSKKVMGTFLRCLDDLRDKPCTVAFNEQAKIGPTYSESERRLQEFEDNFLNIYMKEISDEPKL